MKRTDKEFRAHVHAIRDAMPHYNNGRRVVVVAEGTKASEHLLAKFGRYEGYTLEQVYSRPSSTKQKLFDDCYSMYASDPRATSFSICTHNSYMFTVSWLTSDRLIGLTRDNEYHLIFNE